jgi:hypothetical protein
MDMGNELVVRDNAPAEIPWTRFFDMHSGGRAKEDFELIYIQAPQDQAEVIFYNKFGHNPNRITCSCCGEDYSVREVDGSIEDDIASYSRYGNKHILKIPADMITNAERSGQLPRQGWVW